MVQSKPPISIHLYLCFSNKTTALMQLHRWISPKIVGIMDINICICITLSLGGSIQQGIYGMYSPNAECPIVPNDYCHPSVWTSCVLSPWETNKICVLFLTLFRYDMELMVEYICQAMIGSPVNKPGPKWMQVKGYLMSEIT